MIFASLSSFAADFPALTGIEGTVLIGEHGALVMTENPRTVEIHTPVSAQVCAAWGHDPQARCPYFEGPYVSDHVSDRLLPQGLALTQAQVYEALASFVPVAQQLADQTA